jgi:small subunit ribosomal protein S21
MIALSLQGIKLEVQDEGEPIENVIKRFKRAVNQSGHLQEMRHRELWETAADKRKRKHMRARQLNRIERSNDRFENQRAGGNEYNS